MRGLLALCLLAAPLATSLGACASSGPTVDARPAMPAVQECPRPEGTLLARIRTIAGAPSLRVTLRPGPGDDPRRAADVLTARVIHAGGDVLERAEADGLLTFTLRLPVPTPDALAPLLVQGRLTVHPVADERVGELADLIRTRLAAAPDLLLERWSDGPSAIVSTDRAALVAFIDELPPEPEHHWALMEVPGQQVSYRALLLGPAPITGADIRRCDTNLVDSGYGLQVSMALTDEAAGRFATLTEAQVQRRIAIVIDGRVLVAPVVMEPIRGGQLMLSIRATDPVDRALVAVLRGGELAGPLTLLDFGLVERPRADAPEPDAPPEPGPGAGTP